MTHDGFLSRLENVRESGNGHTARCPAHADQINSLSIGTGDQGDRTVIKCHAGCETEAVVAAMGLNMADLYFEKGSAREQKKEIIATYDYTDGNGTLLYQVVRLKPKSFFQRRPNGNGGWIRGLGNTRRVLYRLPQVIAAVAAGETVFIVAGEKDVHTLEKLGLVATTNSGGEGSKWHHSHSEALRGAHVVIIPDNDETGTKHAKTVRQALEGVAAGVKIIHLPGLGPVLPKHGKDASDWIAQGHTAEELKALVTAPPVNLAKVLDRIADFISDYVFFAKKSQLWAVTLWAFHTHVIDQFEVTAYLHAGSAEKRSGKTRLYEVLALLVKNAWHAINPSEAVFYRKIEAHNPTMLLDETDAIWNHKTASQHEGLRAGINAGYRRGATVDRCAGPRGDQLEAFPVFCAKALAGIGKLPDTIADRCIPINMVRKTKDESVGRFRRRDVEPEAQAIYADVVACASELSLCGYPEMPSGLNDRAEEVWEPLIQIADAAGGHWPKRAREAAMSLSGDFEPEDDSFGVRLLADCRTVFNDTKADRLPSKELLSHLHDLEESPWDDIGLTSRRLASMLKKYGVKSSNHRFEEKILKGYLKSDFEDAWNRYTPLKSDSIRYIGNNGVTMRVSGEFQSATENECSGSKMPPKPADRADVADVADKTPHIGTGEGKEAPPEPEQPTLGNGPRLSCNHDPVDAWRLSPRHRWVCGVCHPPAAIELEGAVEL